MFTFLRSSSLTFLIAFAVSEEKKKSIQRSMPVIPIQNEQKERRSIREKRSVKSATVPILIEGFSVSTEHYI